VQSVVTLLTINSEPSPLNFQRRTALSVRTANQAALASTQVEATYTTKTSTHDSPPSPIPPHLSSKEMPLCRLHSPRAPPHTVGTTCPLRIQAHTKTSRGRGRQQKAKRVISHLSASEV
jgi:hypothetical protein